MGRVVFLILKLTHEAKTQAWMYILHLFEAIYVSHVLSLKRKGLECGPIGNKDSAKENAPHFWV